MNDTAKKHWYQKAWGKVLATISVLTVLGGIVKAVYAGVEFYQDYEQLHQTVETLDGGDADFENRISFIEKYINRKRKSYAVGFRVVTVTDEDTGKQIKVKKYRGWDGVEHTVYKDEYLSGIEGIDYYFWIDEEGERNYCW